MPSRDKQKGGTSWQRQSLHLLFQVKDHQVLSLTTDSRGWQGLPLASQVGTRSIARDFLLPYITYIILYIHYLYYTLFITYIIVYLYRFYRLIIDASSLVYISELYMFYYNFHN